MHAKHQSHPEQHGGHAHGGRLIGWAVRYDILTSVVFGGREGRARRRLAQGSGVRPGDRVLDVGCGTGSLTLALARIAGPGRVAGLDPSAKMLERAAAKKGARAIDFQPGYAQALPFDVGAFDLVTSCLALHHIPEGELAAAFSEMRRVLAPGGRIYLIDFSPTPKGVFGRVFAHLTHGNGGGRLARTAAIATDAGFTGVAVEPTTAGLLSALVGSAETG